MTETSAPLPPESPWTRDLTRELRRLRRRPREEPLAYRPPSALERANHRRFVAAYVAPFDRADPPAAPGDFRAYPFAEGALWILAEAESAKRGAGALVLRSRARSQLIIEAPHTFFDEGTLDLSILLFDRLAAHSLLINTVHRGQSGSGQPDLDEAQRKALARAGDLPSDVAHQTKALFSVAHDVLIGGLPQSLVLQVHGYRDDRLPKFSAVVSDAYSGVDVRLVAERLRRALPDARFGIYPEDTRDLGGAGNAQAALSRAVNLPFVHIELSASLRQRLAEDEAARLDFVRALAPLAAMATDPPAGHR